MINTIDIAIIGATGVVGEAILKSIEEYKLPINKIYPIASDDSLGKTVSFKGRELDVIGLNDFDFAQVKLAFFSAGNKISEKYVPKATAKDCIVIDNTSAFRLDADVPLVIPEVNLEKIAEFNKRGIIANPNCSTIQMLVALKPIYDAVGIHNIHVCTYQAVSGTGRAAISELIEQCVSLLNGKSIENTAIYPQQIAFNVIPFIDSFMENGYSKEEMKMVLETKKILSDNEIAVSPTAVRVPVIYGHSEAIYIETKKNISIDKVKTLLANSSGICLQDDPENNIYPTPLHAGNGTDLVSVGRIRADLSKENGIHMWVVADNVRKGAAANSVQIAKELIENYL